MAIPSQPGISALTVEDALKASEVFLDPVLRKGKLMVDDATKVATTLTVADVLVKARGQSLIDRLITQLPKQTESGIPGKRAIVVRAAVTHLWAIHVALIEACDTCDVKQILYNSKNQRVVDGLLDLISLEGIYPALSPGVGIPIERRVKSVLQAGVAARHAEELGPNEDVNLDLLKEVVDGLSRIVLDGDKAVNPVIRERNLVDVISGCGELAYGNSCGDTNQSNGYKAVLDRLLDEYVKILTVIYVYHFPSAFHARSLFLQYYPG